MDYDLLIIGSGTAAMVPTMRVRNAEWNVARRQLRLDHPSLNTTTSMDRLTLNMLLSFAQLEREVTGDRIRDKNVRSYVRLVVGGGSPYAGAPRVARVGRADPQLPMANAAVRYVFSSRSMRHRMR